MCWWTLRPQGILPAGALLTGAAAAIGASLCCAVPQVLVSLGISGAWLASLTALEPYRPWFATVALGALVFAAWRLYGPSTRCEEGRVCGDPQVLVAGGGCCGLPSRSLSHCCSFPFTSIGLFRSAS
jgi:mercuric ion transport protein